MVAYVSNYFFQGSGSPNDWRWMLGIVGIPSLIFTLLTLAISESPRWLTLHRGNSEEALRVLQQVDADTAQTTLDAILKHKREAEAQTQHRFFSNQYRWPILLAFLLAFFNQASGINAIIYYAPRVFEMAGMAKSSAFLSSTGIGLVNLIFTMAGLSLIDKFGRRVLMYIGSFGYLISLALIARAFYTNQFEGMTVFVFVFIAAHAIGQGAVIWVFISEIFPNEVRAAGQSFGSLTHWVFAAIIANVFPMLASAFGGGPIFLFFTGMMFLQLLFVRFMMPETKGVALEDMQVRVGH